MYRRVVFILLLLFSFSYGQIFNTARLLNNKQFSFSINPVLLNDLGKDDAGIFIQGEYGLLSGMQLLGRIGVGFDETYYGIMIEKSLVRSYPHISFSGGVHSFYDIGLDLNLNISVPLNKFVDLYGGLDSDFVFADKRTLDVSTDTWKKESDTKFLTWFFIGTEVVITRKMNLLFEAEIGIAEEAFNLFGTGVKFYL